MDAKYEAICKKLGFDLKDYKPQYSNTEDDNLENPFIRLSEEEQDYLINNGYLNR